MYLLLLATFTTCTLARLPVLHRRARQRLPLGTVSAPTWSATRRRCRVTSAGSCCPPRTSPTTWGSTTSRSITPATSATAVSRCSAADPRSVKHSCVCGLQFSFTSTFLFVLSEISLILLFIDRFQLHQSRWCRPNISCSCFIVKVSHKEPTWGFHREVAVRHAASSSVKTAACNETWTFPAPCGRWISFTVNIDGGVSASGRSQRAVRWRAADDRLSCGRQHVQRIVSAPHLAVPARREGGGCSQRSLV